MKQGNGETPWVPREARQRPGSRARSARITSRPQCPRGPQVSSADQSQAPGTPALRHSHHRQATRSRALGEGGEQEAEPASAELATGSCWGGLLAGGPRNLGAGSLRGDLCPQCVSRERGRGGGWPVLVAGYLRCLVATPRGHPSVLGLTWEEHALCTLVAGTARGCPHHTSILPFLPPPPLTVLLAAPWSMTVEQQWGPCMWAVRG